MALTLVEASPTSSPVAVNETGMGELPRPSVDKEKVIPSSDMLVLAGSWSRTSGPTVNVPAEAGARQENSAKTPPVMAALRLKEAPVMLT